MKPHWQESLELYRDHHLQPGGFLEAVLENNLMEALGRADLEHRAEMFAIASFIWNEIPRAAWGSREAFDAWLGGTVTDPKLPPPQFQWNGFMEPPKPDSPREESPETELHEFVAYVMDSTMRRLEVVVVHASDARSLDRRLILALERLSKCE